jgi:Bax protein
MTVLSRFADKSGMTITAVIDSVTQFIGDAAAGIRRFVNSAEFQKFLQKTRTWFETAVLWLANVIIGLAIAIVRYLKSDSFRDGVRRARDLATLSFQQGLRGIKWIAERPPGIAVSEAVKTGVATTADLLELFLPKSSQRISAIVAIFVVSIILLSLWPQAEQTETVSIPVPVLEETVSVPEEKVAGLEQPAPAVTPIVSGMPEFGEFPAGRERKAAFFGYFLPIIENQNREILATREKLDDWYQNPHKISARDATEISEIAARYRIGDFDIESDVSWNELFNRVDVVPPSLALAQSANESAWGTSRFAREGLNFFGQWCFKKGCGLVPKKRDANKTHEVAAFDSPQESVRMYIRNLNSNSAYKGMRDIRADLRRSNQSVTGHALAAGLKRYSERGMEYVSELRQMIAGNKLAVYDTF